MNAHLEAAKNLAASKEQKCSMDLLRKLGIKVRDQNIGLHVLKAIHHLVQMKAASQVPLPWSCRSADFTPEKAHQMMTPPQRYSRLLPRL